MFYDLVYAIWTIVENFLWIAEKNVYSVVLDGIIFIYLLNPFNNMK
jgi:hypothetical protein